MEKMLGHHFETHFCAPSYQPAGLLMMMMKLPSHQMFSHQALGFHPLTHRSPKIHGKKAHLTVLSLHDGTLPASNSPTPSNSPGYLQAALSPPPTPALPLSAVQSAEEFIEKTIFNCRFFTLMGVVGSLTGSVLCFFKGCAFVVGSFVEYYHSCLHGIGTGKVILLLVEAVDVYLIGTVMLIFGMGLYELFISTLDVPGGNCFSASTRTTVCGSNLFGLFRLRERPKWLEIRSLDELKTKLGHVIVMILLVGMFEKSKKVPIDTGVDLLCFSASILLSSGCLYFLSKLQSTD